jgi:glycosyltransferase involved in cell wall biosynthesis
MTVGLRVLVVDDNPHVRWRGRVYPVNATFHRFLSAFLDLPGAPVASIAHAVPLRDLRDDEAPPQTLAVDERIHTIATAPFDGIAGFLRRSVGITRANRLALSRAVRHADLVWIKVPASNALLAALLAIQHDKPRFGWIAGSSRAVAHARYRGPARVAGTAVGAAYDVVGQLSAAGGLSVVVGRGLTAGTGVATSLLDDSEVRDGARWPHRPSGIELAWAGRITDGKGVETLIEALPLLDEGVHATIVGDGPARPAAEELAQTLGVAARVQFVGYIADRARYLEEIAGADVFVFPSPAEGFPKVVLDAMAVGTPVISSTAGTLGELANARLIKPADLTPSAIAAAVERLLEQPETVLRQRIAATAFARSHTRIAMAAAVVELWRRRWPQLMA